MEVDWAVATAAIARRANEYFISKEGYFGRYCPKRVIGKLICCTRRLLESIVGLWMMRKRRDSRKSLEYIGIFTCLLQAQESSLPSDVPGRLPPPCLHSCETSISIIRKKQEIAPPSSDPCPRIGCYRERWPSACACHGQV